MNEQDLPLAAQFYDVKYTFPTTFPLSTIHAMRFLRAVEEKYGQGEMLDKAVDGFFVSCFLFFFSPLFPSCGAGTASGTPLRPLSPVFTLEELRRSRRPPPLLQDAVWRPSPSLPAVEAMKPANLPSVASNFLPQNDIDELVQLSTSKEIKEKLKSESAKLVKEGSFGFVSFERRSLSFLQAFFCTRRD